MKNILILFVACLLLVSVTGSAQVPNKISYQGLLTTSSGTPVQNGSYDLQFSIYNLPTGGDLKHDELISSVDVEKGTFSVILNPLSEIFSESLFVEVTAQSGPGISSPITFSPRSELTSAPYAFRADTARYALSAPGQWTTSGSNIYYNSGNVGIGTTSPLGKLDVNASLGTLPLRLTQNANHSYTPSMITMHDADGEVGTIGVVSASGALGMIGLNSLSLSAGTGYGALGVHINTSGNVGIGTTTPDAKLEVAGQIKITGGNPGTDKVLTSDSAGTASWAPPAGAVNCIVCNQTGVITGAPGGYTFNFTAPDCGGSLPDSTYIGVGVQFEICGGFITWRVNQAPNPGVTIYSANGPCDGYDFTVVYLKRQ